MMCQGYAACEIVEWNTGSVKPSASPSMLMFGR